MGNSIDLASKFVPILDGIYKAESKTARLDAAVRPVNFAGANVVEVFKTSLVGLGDYDRGTGYKAGDVTGTWEALTLSKDRGRAFSVDKMDDEETLGQAFGTLASEFIRTQVAPELDAYRFATYASWTGIQTTTAADLSTSSAVLAAVDLAAGALDAKEVPSEGRILFIATGLYRLLMGAVSRTLSNEGKFDRTLQMLDDMTIVPVPQARFYTAITLDSGSSSSGGGYTKGSSAKNINFLLLHPSAVLQVTKLAQPRIFSPEENQTANAWLFQYRIYHDAFVYDNKVDGIYLHKATS